MELHNQPKLFIDTPFPPDSFFTPINTFRPATEFFAQGVKTDISDSNYITRAGFFRDWVLAPLFALSTPFLLLVMVIHFLAQALIHGMNFKTYFATYFVVGSAGIDLNRAEKYREQLESLTYVEKSLFEQVETSAVDLETRAVESIRKKDSTRFDIQLPPSNQPIQFGNEVNLDSIELSDEDHQSLDHIEISRRIQRNLNKSASLRFETINIAGSESKLDGFSVRPYSMQKRPLEEQKWIIYYPGRGTSWETWHNSIINLSKMTGANVLAFNYRGVVRSGRKDLNDPTSPQEVTTSAKMLAEDATAAVKHLLDMGYSKDQVLNYGYSLGGGAASTQTDMAICSDRSFSSLSKAAQAFLWAPIIRHVFAWLTNFVFGKLNSFDNVKKIQENGKQTFICVSKQDAVIEIQDASLYAKFQKQSPELTPPTLFYHYEDTSGSTKERFMKRLNAHMGDVPDAFPELIRSWLNPQ